MTNGHIYEFGPFRLDTEQSVLLRDGQPVALPPKDLGVLTALVEDSGRIVTKEQLLEQVWPNTVVEEGNLARHIFNLRQVLADGSIDTRYIETVPKRGYRMIAAVTQLTSVEGRLKAAPLATERPPIAGWLPELPSVFDGLQVIRLLGQGTTGQVFLAREISLERLVSVKVLRAELASDPLKRTRFLREARAAARITHPNVATIFRVGELSNGIPFSVGEYIEGRTLKELLEIDGPRGSEECVRILVQLADALAAADAKRIIHRDIEPSNVMVENDSDRVVLTDFGLAAIQDTGYAPTERLTRAGEVLGDPRYASPEQILGSPLTASSDIYSLGVLAWELLTGHGPFVASGPQQTAQSHVSLAPSDLAAARPDAPDHLVKAISRCLAKLPQARPRAAELLRWLTASGGADSSMPIDAPQNSLLGRLTRFLKG